MKLFICKECDDVVKMVGPKRECMCGKSGGYLLDGNLKAAYWGSAIPIGFSNASLDNAINNRPRSGQGCQFTAFIIPHSCPTATEIDAPKKSVKKKEKP